MEVNSFNPAVLFKLEDNNTLKVPSDILDLAGFACGDTVRFDVTKEKIVISRNSVPTKETLESLFKNYEEPPFRTKLIDLGAPVGEEIQLNVS